MKTSVLSVNTSLNSSAARQSVTASMACTASVACTSLRTSCNISTPKSTTDSFLCQSAAFTHYEFDDDFEPMSSCEFF